MFAYWLSTKTIFNNVTNITKGHIFSNPLKNNNYDIPIVLSYYYYLFTSRTVNNCLDKAFSLLGCLKVSFPVDELQFL